ncbi:Protein of unknown function [Pustulibacterium marinum]|uniref:DUF2809 domain-containing protein n=1 Tax=Pustulibacterium marinum TaxID=1224947 RepID=A0A1I7G9U8_9FLAO|nr:DUF2809 domain-containing protein [Pustulibacterium marinum]SFU45192.1 Protein of unknown function [Pustulibacterium marinum]
MFKRKTYIIGTLLFFVIEVLIASFFHDRFIRPIFGDYLVVFLVYCFVQSFLVSKKYGWVSFAVLLFAYLIEILQYINLIELLGMQHTTFTRLTLGSSFEWADMLAYTLGVGTLYLIEYLTDRKQKQSKNDILS